MACFLYVFKVKYTASIYILTGSISRLRMKFYHKSSDTPYLLAVDTAAPVAQSCWTKKTASSFETNASVLLCYSVARVAVLADQERDEALHDQSILFSKGERSPWEPGRCFFIPFFVLFTRSDRSRSNRVHQHIYRRYM